VVKGAQQHLQVSVEGEPVKAHNGITASQAALHAQNAELRRRLDNMRSERDEYEQAADALARTLNLMTIENETFRRQVSHLRERSGPTPLTPVT
jgi:hypothetical protein